MNRSDFELTQDEKLSPLWRKLHAYLNFELDTARKQNDDPAPESETSLVRGRIRALKMLINLGGSTPPPVA